MLYARLYSSVIGDIARTHSNESARRGEEVARDGESAGTTSSGDANGDYF